jgi:hypothetical protein
MVGFFPFTLAQDGFLSLPRPLGPLTTFQQLDCITKPASERTHFIPEAEAIVFLRNMGIDPQNYIVTT